MRSAVTEADLFVYPDPTNTGRTLESAHPQNQDATPGFARAKPACAIHRARVTLKEVPRRIYRKEVNALIAAMPRAEQERYLSEHSGAIDWQVRRTFYTIPEYLRDGGLYSELRGLAQEVFLEFVVRYREPAERRVIQCWWNYGKGRLLRSLMYNASSAELQMWIRRGYIRSKARTEWAKINGRPPNEEERVSIHREVDDKLARGLARRADPKNESGREERADDRDVSPIATVDLGRFFERLPPLLRYYFIHAVAMREEGRQIAGNLGVSHQAVSLKVVELAKRFVREMHGGEAGGPVAGRRFNSERILGSIPQDLAWKAIEDVISRDSALAMRPVTRQSLVKTARRAEASLPGPEVIAIQSVHSKPATAAYGQIISLAALNSINNPLLPIGELDRLVSHAAGFGSVTAFHGHQKKMSGEFGGAGLDPWRLLWAIRYAHKISKRAGGAGIEAQRASAMAYIAALTGKREVAESLSADLTVPDRRPAAFAAVARLKELQMIAGIEEAFRRIGGFDERAPISELRFDMLTGVTRANPVDFTAHISALYMVAMQAPVLRVA